MNNENPCRRRDLRIQGRTWSRLSMTALAASLGMLSSMSANAFRMDDGELKVRWDNTVKYSAAWRVADRDSEVESTSYNPNLDDGDRNFGKGLISNRFDLLSELDVVYRNFGARVSAAAWYDTLYNRSTDHDSPFSFNAVSVRNDEFAEATEKLHGRKAEFLDAFVFGQFAPADMQLTLRAGRFTQLYGESLFFGSNGVAAAQSSPDLIKLLSVPGSQFKEILRPVGQVSAMLQISPAVSVGAYVQYEWRGARLPGAGSYFSFADFVDAGGERVILGPPLVPGGGPQSLLRGEDVRPRDNGQGGAQVRFKMSDWEFGLYAARFHDRMPQFYFRPGAGGVDPGSGRVGDYALVYGQDIKVYGASASTVVGDANVAGEVSIRRNMPLVAVGNVVVDPTLQGNGRSNPLYPVGNTFHAQLSALSVLPANDLWEGASFLGELAFNRRLSVTSNASQLDPNATRDALALRFTFQPEYFQVLPGVDIQVPIGVGYGVNGRSSINGIGFPPEQGGDFSVGVKFDYQKQWQGSLNFTHYFGSAGGIVDRTGALSYDQVHRDRDFIAFSIQRTF